MSKQTDLINVTDAITVDGSNVGIGTDSPSLGSNGAGLHIKGASGDYGVLKVDSSTTSEEGWVQFSNNGVDKFRIASDSSTNLKFIHSGVAERMRIDATGAVTMPHQPAFSVHKDGNYQNNLAVNADVVVTFNDERFDANADFNLGTNSFTAPVTGKYQLSLALRLENIDSAAAYYIPTIVTSNQRYRFVFDPDFGQDQAYWGITISVLADMDASDTAHITIEQGNGNQQTDIQGNAQYTFFTGYLAC